MLQSKTDTGEPVVGSRTKLEQSGFFISLLSNSGNAKSVQQNVRREKADG